MKKRRLTEVAEEAGVSPKAALELAKEKLSSEMMTGKGGATWLTPEGVQVLTSALTLPESVPQYHRAYVIKPAPNSKYVFAQLEENKMVVPVFVQGRYRGRNLWKKNIQVEMIEDAAGRSYRHVPKG